MGASGPFQDKPVVAVENLALVRGGRRLFENLSFRAAGGDYVEIHGPNGSGKTSLLKAIAGYLRPHAGKARIENVEDPALALHYLGHLNALKSASTVRAHARYWAGLFGARGGESEALEVMGLARAANAPARALSQGQARRLAFARLMIAPRPVWILDEPAAALDAEGRAIVAEAVRAQCARNGVVLAAVHEPLGPTPTQTLTLGAA